MEKRTISHKYVYSDNPPSEINLSELLVSFKTGRLNKEEYRHKLTSIIGQRKLSLQELHNISQVCFEVERLSK